MTLKVIEVTVANAHGSRILRVLAVNSDAHPVCLYQSVRALLTDDEVITSMIVLASMNEDELRSDCRVWRL